MIDVGSLNVAAGQKAGAELAAQQVISEPELIVRQSTRPSAAPRRVARGSRGAVRDA